MIVKKESGLSRRILLVTELYTQLFKGGLRHDTDYRRPARSRQNQKSH